MMHQQTIYRESNTLTIQGFVDNEKLRFKMQVMISNNQIQTFEKQIKSVEQFGQLSKQFATFDKILAYMKYNNMMLKVDKQKGIIYINGRNHLDKNNMKQLSQVQLNKSQIKIRDDLYIMIEKCRNNMTRLGGDEIKQFFILLANYAQQFKASKNQWVTQQNINNITNNYLSIKYKEYIESQLQQIRNSSNIMKTQIINTLTDSVDKILLSAKNNVSVIQKQLQKLRINTEDLNKMIMLNIQLLKKQISQQNKQLKYKQEINKIAQQIQKIQKQLKKLKVYKKQKTQQVQQQKNQEQKENISESKQDQSQNQNQEQSQNQTQNRLGNLEYCSVYILSKTNITGWVDPNCFFDTNIKIENNIITSTDDQQSNTVFAKRKLVGFYDSFEIQIIKMIGMLEVGIANIDQETRKQYYRQIGQKTVYYQNDGSCSIDNQIKSKNKGFKEGDRIQVCINFKLGYIQWKVNKQIICKALCPQLSDQSIQWVPYICLYSENDSIRIIKQ